MVYKYVKLQQFITISTVCQKKTGVKWCKTLVQITIRPQKLHLSVSVTASSN